jgi:sirohydrochlorin cobaltochelatase
MTRHNQLGLLLVGHGTRSRIGVDQFLALTREVARRLDDVAVEPAFLELQKPDIGDAMARLNDRGVKELTVMPLLLLAAGHAKEDIPRAIEAAQQQLPNCKLQIKHAAHLGCDPALVELSAHRYEQAVGSKSPLPPEHSCLLLVGRGSRDEGAVAEMHQFARLRQSEGGLHTVVAFLAMARPSLGEQLDALAASSFRRIVVQPHLLFEGELAESLREQTIAIARKRPEKEWLVAPLLADRLGETEIGTNVLVDLIVRRSQQARIRVVPPASDD